MAFVPGLAPLQQSVQDDATSEEAACRRRDRVTLANGLRAMEGCGQEGECGPLLGECFAGDP